MNLRAVIKYHEREALQLSRSRKSVAARMHSIRAEQLKTVQQIKREVRNAVTRSTAPTGR